MGKASVHNTESAASASRIRTRSSKRKFLKPGALAQLHNKPSAAKPCNQPSKRRGAGGISKKNNKNTHDVGNSSTTCSPVMRSPVDQPKKNILLRTPKTPRVEAYESESRLETLPMDLLVKITCHLHHDHLKSVFHVSQRIRKAVVIAIQFHFNYTTPDRSRHETLSTITPRAADSWPFLCKGSGKGSPKSGLHTPNAPRAAPRLPSRIRITEMRHIAAVLFQDVARPPNYMLSSALGKPGCQNLASSRALFYEDELCQAVAQNKLR